MNILKNLQKLLFLIVIPALIISVFVFSDTVIYLVSSISPCTLYTNFGFLCPACGNTRSVIALLHGDILGSLRYNLVIVFICLILLGLYTERVAAIFNKKIKIVPRSSIFIFGSVAFFLIYFVVRNFFIV